MEGGKGKKREGEEEVEGLKPKQGGKISRVWQELGDGRELRGKTKLRYKIG